MPDLLPLVIELRSTLAKMEQILGTVDEAIVWTNHTGRILWCNATFDRLLGRPRIQNLGSPLVNRLPLLEEDLASPCQLHPARQALETGDKGKGFYGFRQRDRLLVLEISWSCFQDQDLEEADSRSAILVIRDITVQRRAELALRESEQRYATLAQAAPVGIFRTNNLGDCLYVNERWCEISGLTADEAVGPGWANGIHPDDHELVAAELYAAAQANRPFGLEYRFINAAGQITWVYGQSVAERDDAGSIVGYIGTLTDISDRKRAEAKLQLANEELMRATRLKDEFLANMSHELRTPLNAILGMTEGLQEEVFGIVNDKQLNALHAVEKSATHLLSLINDILDVAKIESGQVILEYSKVSVQQLCSSSLSFVKQQAFKKNIQLHTEVAPHLDTISVDEVRIRQVLINLLTNAVKFTPEGGTVNLTVSLLPQENTSPTYLHIAVTDTGIGISPENRAKLFKPFAQIDGALNRKHSGTGLGLALVKQIVELHGGKVGLTSELGVGSCFTIDLPYAPRIHLSNQAGSLPLDRESTPPLANAPTFDQPPLVLLAEDNPDNVATISSYLEAKGYRILLANNGWEAIDLSISQQPDVILMDIQMPDLDGLEAMGQIRQQSSLQDTPIIALTALAMKGDQERCLAAGADYYLSKPVKLKQLDNLLKEILADRRPAS